MLRVPWLLALATLACVPARIPVHVGSTQANLLLPLYGVVVVAALALAWELYGDDSNRSRELGPLAWPVAAFVAWDGLSLLWSKDPRQGAIELLFFVLPFGLLAVALARLAWSRAWVLTLYVQLALMALVFAVIGIVQYETRNIFWNPKVRVDNAYAPSGWFYRVNSVFYDPSIYGRFLVVGILASLVVVLFRRGDPLWSVAAGADDRDHLGRPAAVVLAVELPGADGRGRGRRRRRVGPAQPAARRGRRRAARGRARRVSRDPAQGVALARDAAAGRSSSPTG